MRNFLITSALASMCFAPDTGAGGGGTATAEAPASGAAAGDVTTANAAATPGEKPRAKRGRAAAGTSVFMVDAAGAALTEETCKTLAKEKGGKFTAFRVDTPAALGKPARFFVSNHRNAVQHSVMTTDGYKVAGILGSTGKAADPAKTKEKAAKALDAMSEEDRRALFLRYMGTPDGAAAVAKSAEAPLPPRNDTSADFHAAPPAAAAPKGTPAPAAPAASAAKGGNAKRK